MKNNYLLSIRAITQYLSSNDKAKLIILVIILSALSFNHAFNFHLFVDDWYQILGALYYPEVINSGLWLGTHPVSVLEFKLFAGVFKFNPYYWQFLGYLLKVIDSLSMWVLMMALTQSKRVAFLAALIFAVFVVGIESVSWVSTHSSAVIIPLLNLGFYFWIRSENNQLNRYFFYSLILFAVSILAEPGRAVMVAFLIPIWEFLSVYQRFSITKTFTSLLKITLLFPLIGLVYFLAKKYFNISPDFNFILQGLSLINFRNIVLSLQNPLFGWTLLTQQLTFWVTVIFLFTNIAVLILFIWKRYTVYKIIIFLCIWIPLFYLPNFLNLAHTKSGVAMESRYYAISAVGIVGLLSYGFSSIKSKYINWIIVVFLVFNLYVTNNVLKGYSSFRSIQVHNKIWNKIDNDVPKDEKMSVFMYSGENYLHRERLLDWMDTIPFAVKRGIIRKEEFPIMTNDKNLIARLVCEKNVLRHSPFGDLIQKEPISLSHVHAWELKNRERELENRSDQERDGIKRIASCLQSK